MRAVAAKPLEGVKGTLARDETTVRLGALAQRGISPQAIAGPFHESPKPAGTSVRLASSDGRNRTLRLSVVSHHPYFRPEWVRWVLPARKVSALKGGDSAEAQDAIFDDGTCRLLLTPHEAREVLLAFEAPLDGVNAPGDLDLYVVATDDEEPHAGRERMPFLLRLRHPDSNFLHSLPSIYAESMLDLMQEEDDRTAPPFFERYLRGFEDSLEPLWATLDHLDGILGAYTAPAHFLSFLAGWTAMPLAEGLPEMAKRRYLAEAVAIVRWRGTARGLRHLLRIVSPGDCRIDEASIEGMRLGPDATLGSSATKLGNVGDHFFRVTLTVPDPNHLDVRAVHRAISWCKPAHTVYELVVLPA